MKIFMTTEQRYSLPLYLALPSIFFLLWITLLKKQAVFEVKICKIIEKRSGKLLEFHSLLSLSLIFIYCTSCGKYSRREILGAVRRREWGWFGSVERKGIPRVLGGTVCACLCRHFGLEHCCG